MLLKALVVAIGAAIVIGGCMVKGYVLHQWALRYAPGIAAWIPRDGGAIVGALLGVSLVTLWAVG